MCTGRLGAASTALGFIAGFTGDALQQGLCAMGLHTDFVRLAQGATRINVKLKAQRETDINAAGPAVDKAALAALLEKLDALGPHDILVLAAVCPPTCLQIFTSVFWPACGRAVCVLWWMRKKRF